jgi:cation diffusion facilitator family transporter
MNENTIDINVQGSPHKNRQIESGDLTSLNRPREHTNTMISKKEREIIENIKIGTKQSQKNAIRKLIIVSVICLFFMAVELVGNYLSGSLAILSDALHMLCDFSGFAISMISIIISKRKPTKKMSFGYHRAEVVGALLSVLVIWVLTAWLVYEGIERIQNGKIEIESDIMLIVAIVGLICNLLMGHVLHSSGVYRNNIAWA